MKVGSEKVFGAGYNVLPIWKKRLDAKTLVTTPNSDVIYAMSYVDLGKDGPVVFEAPPQLQVFWRRRPAWSRRWQGWPVSAAATGLQKGGPEWLFRVPFRYEQRVHFSAFVLSGSEESDASRLAR